MAHPCATCNDFDEDNVDCRKRDVDLACYQERFLSGILSKSLNTVNAFMRIHIPLKVYYFAYPYTESPRLLSDAVGTLVKRILEIRKDIVPLVPHFMFDAMYDYPEGYGMTEIMGWECEIIGRCDALVYDSDTMSAGVAWEVAVARKLGKPVFTYDEIMKKVDLE